MIDNYKVQRKIPMCWAMDGRLNVSIEPYELRNNLVQDIILKLDEFQLIKGLALGGVGFKQYCKINGDLYEMSDEVSKYRKNLMKKSSDDIKSYLKKKGLLGTVIGTHLRTLLYNHTFPPFSPSKVSGLYLTSVI